MRITAEERDDEMFCDIALSRRDFDLIRLGQVADRQMKVDGVTVHVHISAPYILEEWRKQSREQNESETAKSEKGDEGMETRGTA